MTHEIVQSDVELARRLMDAGCQDSEICAGLRWRGVDATKADALLEALHQGKLVKVELPLASGLRRHHRHRTSRRHAGGPYATMATTCPASNYPLYFHYDHRPRWRRITKKTIQWAIACLFCFGLLWCIGYVGLHAWIGAKQNAEALDNRNPDWRNRVSRLQNGLPDTTYDDLNARHDTK
jgi:hypothetical protein